MNDVSNPNDPVLDIAPLGFPWPTLDPFLFCAYHNDDYPAGTDALGPDPSLLQGRNLGMDFETRDGFRMYHGSTVPGFPAHPHRGFETITFVTKGYCDHSDSLGASARFGAGDAQWITTGAGISHSEMFPLLNRNAPNPLELFQVWLNLPSSEKMTPAHFSVFWSQEIPTIIEEDSEGRLAKVTIVAGAMGERQGPEPPPHSWAHDEENDVAMWTIELAAGRTWTLPKTKASTNRTLYFFSGGKLRVGKRIVEDHSVLLIRANEDLPLEAVDGPVQLLLLQGKPIGEPVVQHGPFVMNDRAQIQQAIRDYQQTNFGSWEWEKDDPDHGPTRGRFAKQPDGSLEEFPLELSK